MHECTSLEETRCNKSTHTSTANNRRKYLLLAAANKVRRLLGLGRLGKEGVVERRHIDARHVDLGRGGDRVCLVHAAQRHTVELERAWQQQLSSDVHARTTKLRQRAADARQTDDFQISPCNQRNTRSTPPSRSHHRQITTHGEQAKQPASPTVTKQHQSQVEYEMKDIKIKDGLSDM